MYFKCILCDKSSFIGTFVKTKNDYKFVCMDCSDAEASGDLKRLKEKRECLLSELMNILKAAEEEVDVAKPIYNRICADYIKYPKDTLIKYEIELTKIYKKLNKNTDSWKKKLCSIVLKLEENVF